MGVLVSSEEAPVDALEPQVVSGEWGTDRWATAGVWVLILYTAVRSVMDAASKPFWFDELATVAVAGQADLASMWKAFDQAADSSTPLFWMTEHFFGSLIPNQEIAYRLPAILGFGCVLWCLFVFVRRRFGSAVALLCATVPILTPLYRPYAIEARGYALVVACVAFALVCYQRASRSLWTLFMALSLVLAGAFHYYAFLAFFPLGLAELTLLLRKKNFRWGVWLAILAGFLPTIAGWRHLMQLKQFYGTHFWGQANLTRALLIYGSLLRTNFSLAIAVGAALSAGALWLVFAPEVSWAAKIHGADDHSHEPMLAVGFLGLLLVEFLIAEVTHGPLVDRYALAIALGLSLAAAYLVYLLGRRGIVLLAIFLSMALASQEAYSWFYERGPFGKLQLPVQSIATLLRAAGHDDLPVVMSDAQQYMMLAYYTPPQWSKRFVGLADPGAAVVYSGSDSVDRQMLALRCCLALQVHEFPEFAAGQKSFLVYSDGSEFDWWPQRLSRSGYSLRLLAMSGSNKVYLAEQSGG